MITTSRRAVLGAMLSLFAAACTDSSTAPAKQPPVQLKDVVYSSLPSPYYHFEYDTAGRVAVVSFASDLSHYEVTYAGDRVVEMTNTVGSHDRLQYVYDTEGRATLIKYVDATGQVYTIVSLWYDGGRLTKLERDRRVTGGFIIDKTMAFTYYADGNLEQLTEHRPMIDGVQTEATRVTRFEQYDNKINVDDFDLIHNDFFDHLVLLPGVRLQKNNAAHETQTGDGLTYVADYQYTYDDRNRPLSKAGTVTVTQNGSPVTVVQISADYSYYQ